MTDFQKALGALLPQGTIPMTVFIPGKDRDGDEINQGYWVDQCLRTMGKLYGGGTAFPPGTGVWRDDERGGTLLVEPVVMVTSYARHPEVTDLSLVQLRSFLHRMGREARQGEIGLVVDGIYYRIQEFDEEVSP